MLVSFVFFCLSLFAERATAQGAGAYIINGKNENMSRGTAYLFTRINGKMVTLDSFQMSNGQFTFSGAVPIPEMRYIGFDNIDIYTSVFLENSTISVIIPEDEPKSADITGSSVHDLYSAFNRELEVYSDQLENLRNHYQKAISEGDEALEGEYETKCDSLEISRLSFISRFVRNHGKSSLSPFLTLRYLIYSLRLDELQAVVASFDSVLDSSVYVRLLNNHVEFLSHTAVGRPAVDFTLFDTAGSTLKLSSMYGHYLLIDFWASWCGPCRRENPHMRSVYEKYHPLGFEILGVSLDQDKKKWIDAIKSDSLNWTQVSDLQGWNNAAARQYAINSIPYTVLLDPNGMIIARGFYGGELDEKLKELYD